MKLKLEDELHQMKVDNEEQLLNFNAGLLWKTDGNPTLKCYLSSKCGNLLFSYM